MIFSVILNVVLFVGLVYVALLYSEDEELIRSLPPPEEPDEKDKMIARQMVMISCLEWQLERERKKRKKLEGKDEPTADAP